MPSGSVTGTLQSIRIVDLTIGLAGPLATRLLAEAGADVLKVEPPGGDPMRQWSPSGFASWNRSKRSVVLNLKQRQGREELNSILAHADVLVHSLRPSKAAALGLDNETLQKRFPELIVASVTGYPLFHPDAERPGFEILVQARSGAMDEQQGYRPGPVFIRMPFSNFGAAFLLAGGVVVRLYERLRTGVARSIHTSLLQGALAPMSLYWQRRLPLDEWIHDHTLPKAVVTDLTIFQCRDSEWIHVIGGFYESAPVLEILAEMDLVDLAANEVTPATRETWERVFRRRTRDEWIDLFVSADVPCTPVLDIGEVLLDSQCTKNGYSVEVQDPIYGRTLQDGSPFQTEPPCRVISGAPSLNAHPQGFLGWSGSSSSRLPQRDLHSAHDLPLRGVRVLDFGMYVAGPFGAQCLADFGADVIKIEPISGDRGRWLNQFIACQRGKRSLAMDLDHPGSRDILERLVKQADIVIHNIRSSAAVRLGIDEPSLRAINQEIIFCHASAFGVSGQLSSRPAYDPTAQALSGWEIEDAGEGNRPTYLRASPMDPYTGLSAFLAISLAMFNLENTGRPSGVSTSLLGIAALTASETVVPLPDGAPVKIAVLDIEQTGTAPGHRIYQTSDGWIAVAALNENELNALLRIAGVRSEHEIQSVFQTMFQEVLFRRLTASGVPFEAVEMDNMNRFFDRELSNESGLIMKSDTHDYGVVDHIGAYWTTNGSTPISVRPIPGLGEHTVEVLIELGYSVTDVEGLAAIGAIGLFDPSVRNRRK